MAWRDYHVMKFLEATIEILKDTLKKYIRIQLNLMQNLIVIHAEKEAEAQKLAEIHQINLRNRCYPTYVYLPAPDNSVRGVVHEIERTNYSMTLR